MNKLRKILGNRINYSKLHAKQKENFNFHKIAAILSEYGYNSIRLNDDWEGADFLAYRNTQSSSKDAIDTNNIIKYNTLKVQLKGRITIQKKYRKKKIYIAFPDKGVWYLYPHDEFLAHLEKKILCLVYIIIMER